ncbi:GNAT family N-acetyltransferase [Nonomuraea sp. NN258]|uniref:GNAT family N-acetyltransferase n=1 Tax=Nonomuraea antri TaxID=2730852 RepID=UPI0015697ADC|nr:GNAT family N-acetyltransferase [Nonomuraea antri]NRQ32510.1 GNAT family N-acetyltransferase [Nonomuraea antri]
MRVRVVRAHELGAAELAAWRSFQRLDLLLENPYLSPDFVQAVAGYRGDVHVAVLTRDGEPAGFFPFERGRGGLGRPVGAGFTDVQGIVTAPGVRLEPRRLLRDCGLSVWSFDHLLGGQFAEFHRSVSPSPVMDLTGGFEAYRERITARSTKTYKSAAYRERRLGRDVGETRHVFDSRDPADLRALLAWKSAQYRATGQRDLFAEPAFTELIERLHQEPGECVRGVLSMLYAGDRPIAGHFGLVSGRVFAGWFPAYDRKFAWYSPGLVQHLGLAADAAERGVRHIHLGKGQAAYKDFLATEQLAVAEGRIARPGPAAAAHWAVTVPGGRARDLLRRSAAVRGLARRVRTWRNGGRRDE